MYEGIQCNLNTGIDYVRSAQAYHKTLTIEGLNSFFFLTRVIKRESNKDRGRESGVGALRRMR